MTGLSELPSELLDEICLYLPWNKEGYKSTTCNSSSSSISFRFLDNSALFNFGRTCKKHFQVARRLYNQWLIVDITCRKECGEIIRLLRRIHDKSRAPTTSIRRLYLLFPKGEHQVNMEHIRTTLENLSFLGEVASSLNFRLPDYLQKETLGRYLEEHRHDQGWIGACYGAISCGIILSTLLIARLKYIEHLVLDAPDFIIHRIAGAIRSLKQPTLPALCSLILVCRRTQLFEEEYHAFLEISQLWPNTQELCVASDCFHRLHPKYWDIKWMTSILLSNTSITERDLLQFLHGCPKLASLTCKKLVVRDPSQPDVLFQIISGLEAASETLRTLCLDVDFNISPFRGATGPMPHVHKPVLKLAGFTKLENLWINCESILKSDPENFYHRRQTKASSPTSIRQRILQFITEILYKRRQNKGTQSVLLEKLPTSIRRLHLAKEPYKLRISLTAVVADCSRGKLPHLREVAIEDRRGELQSLRQRFENAGVKVCERADRSFTLW